MTLKEILAKAGQERAEFVALANRQIGMGNYKEIMREYQKAMLDLYSLLIEQTMAVDAALKIERHPKPRAIPS